MSTESGAYCDALKLKAEGKYREAIAELQSILDRGIGNPGFTNWRLAALYMYELEQPTTAYPFAAVAVKEAPISERASVCLVHCLSALGDDEAVDAEIRRFVATGAELREYQQLFEENGLTVADYT